MGEGGETKRLLARTLASRALAANFELQHCTPLEANGSRYARLSLRTHVFCTTCICQKRRSPWSLGCADTSAESSEGLPAPTVQLSVSNLSQCTSMYNTALGCSLLGRSRKLFPLVAPAKETLNPLDGCSWIQAAVVTGTSATQVMSMARTRFQGDIDCIEKLTLS